MKKIISIALIASFSFSDTLVVDKDVICNRWRCMNQCTNATNNNDYFHTIADALKNADDGDEIIICPGPNDSKTTYNESNLRVKNENLYIHSYKNDASKVEVADDSGDNIFIIKEDGVEIRGLTISQNSDDNQAISIWAKNNIKLKDLIINSKNQGFYTRYNLYNSLFEDINVTSSNNAFYFKEGLFYSIMNKINIDSDNKGIKIKGDNENNQFNELNITSENRCFESDGIYFKNVDINNSEFNQTTDAKYAFVTYATKFYNNNFNNIEINSSGYGFYFDAGLKDSNFTKFYLNSKYDAFIVNSKDMENIRFIDSNSSSEKGRAISINDGNLIDSYFDDFNLSANYEALYTDDDIDSSKFNNFIINGSTGFYVEGYIKKSSFNSGEIKASRYGIYSYKELNQTNLNNLKIKAVNYGIVASLGSSSGAINDENNLTNLYIIQTSDYSADSGIRFKKRVNNSLFKDINISAKSRGIWLSTGGYYNTFDTLELNSSTMHSFVNSGLLYENNFTNITTNSYTSGFYFGDDVKYNSFENLTLNSQKYGIYGPNDDDYIEGNKFNNVIIKAEYDGLYIEEDCKENNFTNFYVRVNKYEGFRFFTYSRNNYFYNIDTNGTKGLDFNISEGDKIRKINAYTVRNEPIYFSTIQTNPVIIYDLNLTSTKDNCIYVGNLNDDLNISTIDFDRNDLNCSNYNGIQISEDSTNSLEVKNTKFTFNANSFDTSRGLIKAKSLNTLYIKNNIFDAANKRRGIYISSNLDNFYAFDNIFENSKDTAIYLKRVNKYLSIQDNNISNSSDYGIYVYTINSGFIKGEIKGNIFKDNGNYAINLFYENEQNVDFEVWKNCFYDNGGESSQAYTYDSIAKYDDGKIGNYWSDWNGSGYYPIDPIPIYDHHPVKSCNFNVQNYSFNAVSKIIYDDAVKDWDNNLTTKIVNKSFSTYILSKNTDTNTSEEANITKVVFMYYTEGNDNDCSGENEANKTICDDDTSNSCPDTNSNGEVEISNINVDRAVKCVKVHIEGIGASSNEVQEANSTDDFAIRPKEFNITNIPDKIKAGSDFNLTFRAFDENGDNSKEYNESLHLDTTVKIEVNVTDSDCKKGDFNLIDGGEFKDGEANATFKYSEVGDLNISVKEIEGSEFAKVDEDDTNWSERAIKENSAILTFVVHHFDANVSVSDFDVNFTYLDNNLTIFSLIDLNITAKNKDNKTTENYNNKCAAKDIDVNLSPYVHRHTETLNKEILYQIFYENSISSIYKNKDILFSISKDEFNTEHNGSAFVKVHTNFERNISNPEDPFEYNISNIKIKNEDSDLTYFTNEGNSTFFYGYLNMNDIVTVKDDFNISHEFLIYDNNESDTYLPDKNREILLYWFLNLYNKTKDANITNFVVTKGYVYKDEDVISGVDVSVIDINESLNLEIKRNDDSINFAVVHIIDTNASHLWYSTFENEYNISKNSSCANHFCFTITWENTNSNNNKVESGDTNGTKAEINASNVHKRGVKIFR